MRFKQCLMGADILKLGLRKPRRLGWIGQEIERVFVDLECIGVWQLWSYDQISALTFAILVLRKDRTRNLNLSSSV